MLSPHLQKLLLTLACVIPVVFAFSFLHIAGKIHKQSCRIVLKIQKSIKLKILKNKAVRKELKSLFGFGLKVWPVRQIEYNCLGGYFINLGNICVTFLVNLSI